jgi:hypothetical protein
MVHLDPGRIHENNRKHIRDHHRGTAGAGHRADRMNRPEARNAQNLQMTYDLNAAFDAAVQDEGQGHHCRQPAFLEPARPFYRLNHEPVLPEEMLPVVPEYLNGRAYTIFGGSSEIQRDIVAKMMLGL